MKPGLIANPGRLTACFVAAVAGLLVGHGARAADDKPLSSASSRELLDRLGTGGLVSRTLQLVELPDSSQFHCRSEVGAGTKPATPGGPSSRTLEVVPYAGNTTAGVNLDIRFKLGSSVLQPDDMVLLSNLAIALNDESMRATTFAVAGHTDALGKPEENLRLSCLRATSVLRDLQGKGIELQRMAAYGFGSTRQLRNEMPATAPENRRVEVRLAP